MKKTICITSFHALISRNILETEILSLLVKKGFKVILLVPKAKEDYFTKTFSGEHVLVRGFEYNFGVREKFIKYLSLCALNTTSLKIKRKTEMKGSGSFLTHIISNRVGIAFIRCIEKYTYSHDIFGSFFKEFNPDTIFATDIQSELDVAILNEAKKNGIKTIGMVRSWDNLTSKGLIRTVPKKLLVWNSIIADEAVRLHDIKKDTITIVGIPHYDNYHKYSSATKEDFFKVIGADMSKKIVLMVPIGDRYLENNTVDKDMVHILDEELSDEYQILVRLPPGDYVRSLENNKKIWKQGRVIFDRTDQPFENIKMTEISKKDDIHLAQTLKWSDIVVSGPSTMVIDAVYMDRPVILYGFDGYEKRSYLKSIRRYYDYNNFVHVVKSGGVLFAQNIESFRTYIHNPYIPQNNRKKLAIEQVTYVDGTATERLLENLIK